MAESSLLRFYDVNGNIVGVNVGRTCSGLHSVALFISVFTAFFVSKSNSIDLEFVLFILAGIVLSYIANLIRILAIVLVGIHFSYEDMIWAHNYLGWFFFTLWFYVFWEIYFFVKAKNFFKIV